MLHIFIAITIAFLAISWSLCGVIGLKLWLEWRSLCRTYDKMEYTVDQINQLLTEEEAKVLNELMDDIERHLRER